MTSIRCDTELWLKYDGDIADCNTIQEEINENPDLCVEVAYFNGDRKIDFARNIDWAVSEAGNLPTDIKRIRFIIGE